jgi:hypothetical protein
MHDGCMMDAWWMHSIEAKKKTFNILRKAAMRMQGLVVQGHQGSSLPTRALLLLLLWSMNEKKARNFFFMFERG